MISVELAKVARSTRIAVGIVKLCGRWRSTPGANHRPIQDLWYKRIAKNQAASWLEPAGSAGLPAWPAFSVTRTAELPSITESR
jgi:hypothetical protein